MADFVLKANDLLPPLTATLTDADGNAVDLTGATVVFTMTDTAGVVKVNEAAVTVVSAPAGTVRYAWAAGDTDTPGLFYGEFEATWSGKPESFPNDGHLVLQITGELA